MLCETCGKEHTGEYASGRFCNITCSKIYSTLIKRKETNLKTSQTLKNKPLREVKCSICGNILLSNSTCPKIHCIKCRKVSNICKRCGSIKGTCKFPKLCNKNLSLFDGLHKYFGFDMSCFGSEKYYQEIFRIKDLIEEDYLNNEMSIPELAEKYNHNNFGNFSKLLKSIDVSIRRVREAIILNYKLGKTVSSVNTKYKHGYHTTWDNKKVFYRSSYELDYAKYLDENKIKYEMEALRIKYYDSQRCIERIAIPDFYLPDTNDIIEIKSSYTYNEQNMKDKQLAYFKHGYKLSVILDHIKII